MNTRVFVVRDPWICWELASAGKAHTECHPWPGARDKDRYGRVHVPSRGTTMPAHRWVFEQLNGVTLPPSVLVRHYECDYPPCVNWRHLRAGSHQDNADDRVAHGRSGRGLRPIPHRRFIGRGFEDRYVDETVERLVGGVFT